MKMRAWMIILALMTLHMHVVNAQPYSTRLAHLDSLLKETRLPHSADEMSTLYMRISTLYLHRNSDSTIYYAEKGLEYNKNSKNVRLRFSAIGTMVDALMYQGNLPRALEIALDAADEKTDLSLGNSNKGRIYYGIGEIYTYLEDYKKAKFYFTEIINMTGLDVMGVAFGHYQLAKLLLVENKLDSALYHLNKSYETFSIINKSANPYLYEAYPGWYNTRARVYLKQNKPDLAKADLFKTLAITKNSGEEFHTSNTYYDLAFLFQTLRQRDSSIYYAEKALSVADRIHYTRGVLNASEILYTLYEETDSKKALWFYKINGAAKDQLYSAGNVQAMRDVIAQNEKRTSDLANAEAAYQNKLKQYLLFSGLGVMLLLAFILYRNNRRKEKANQLLQSQKEEIDYQKQAAEKALKDLKLAQFQLIQSEKMASLGELTAGIAHEIQNPLNFVNNFSEVNNELIDELTTELGRLPGGQENGNWQLITKIAGDIKQNLDKIDHHGKRADGIVKSMLQHSRTSSGQKELTDINALCDECLRLAYHGYRAKDKSFNANPAIRIETDFDSTLPKINVVPQDIGRVVLNLINNAFYAVSEKSNLTTGEAGNQQRTTDNETYEPLIVVSTKNLADQIEIIVQDNGPGVPDSIKEKIFQPFFTTKPTGQGTGLGLSLSYDIVTALGGEIKMKSKEGKGTEFIIQITARGDQ